MILVEKKVYHVCLETQLPQLILLVIRRASAAERAELYFQRKHKPTAPRLAISPKRDGQWLVGEHCIYGLVRWEVEYKLHVVLRQS